MDPLDRLYWRLVETLRRAPAPPPERGLTIADVYQVLVPYRAVRADLGLYELAEYEHALLRLLAGEREYVRIEDAAIRDELRSELASPNPILGLYRDYSDAALTVRFGADAAAPAPASAPVPAAPPEPASRAAAPPPRPAAPPSGPARPDATEPRAPAAAALDSGPLPRAGRPAAERAPAAGAPPAAAPPAAAPGDAPAAPRASTCRSCRTALPQRRDVRFCPFCGVSQPSPCRGCGALLDANWSFCIRCGQARNASRP
jgi:hypothetical protein